MECEHKWKIIKEIPLIERGLIFFWRINTYTIYHLKCEKCGNINRRWTEGIENKKGANE